jgi:transcription elongation factor GreA-like protein
LAIFSKAFSSHLLKDLSIKLFLNRLIILSKNDFTFSLNVFGQVNSLFARYSQNALANHSSANVLAYVHSSHEYLSIPHCFFTSINACVNAFFNSC